MEPAGDGDWQQEARSLMGCLEGTLRYWALHQEVNNILYHVLPTEFPVDSGPKQESMMTI